MNPIYGADRVERFLLGVVKKTPPELVAARIADVNGEPGAVFTFDGVTSAVVTIDVGADHKIRGIFWVVNPEKLSPETGI